MKTEVRLRGPWVRILPLPTLDEPSSSFFLPTSHVNERIFMSDFMSIYRANESTQAELIKSKLENAGIQCFLKSDDLGGLHTALTLVHGIDVMVNMSDVKQAFEILAEESE